MHPAAKCQPQDEGLRMHLVHQLNHNLLIVKPTPAKQNNFSRVSDSELVMMMIPNLVVMMIPSKRGEIRAPEVGHCLSEMTRDGGLRSSGTRRR